MPNHVHLIAVPQRPEDLGRTIGEAHRQYAIRINKREKWTGHLWQQRFSSYPMDEEHLLTAARYIEMNPVAAGLRPSPEAWPWSSARAHLMGRNDRLVVVAPILKLIPDWKGFLTQIQEDAAIYKEHEATGFPLGGAAFVEHCELLAGRILRRQKRGPKGPRNVK